MSRRKQNRPQHISNGSDEDDEDDRKLHIDIKDDAAGSKKNVGCDSETKEPTTQVDETEEKEHNLSNTRQNCELQHPNSGSKHKGVTRSDGKDKSNAETSNANLTKLVTEEDHRKDGKKSGCSESDCNGTEKKKISKSTNSAHNVTPGSKRSARNHLGGVSSSGNVIVTRTVARLRQQGRQEDGVKRDGVKKDGPDKKRKYESDSDADESDQDELAETWTPEKPAAGQVVRSAGRRRSMTSEGNPRVLGRTCEYCGAVKPTPAALQRHLRKHTGERPFICKVCTKAYKAKRSLQLHLLSNHPEEIDKSAPMHIKQDTSTQLREAIEQKIKHERSLDDSTSLRSPPDSKEHSASSDPKLATEGGCPVGAGPGGGLVDRQGEGLSCSLDELSNSHAMSRTCRYCGKVCLKPSDLKRHVLLHTGDKPYTCEVCGKSFKAKGSMLYHQKAAHNMNVELSQSLAERYMKLKNRSYEKSLYVQERIAEYHQQMLNGSVKNEMDEPCSLGDNQQNKESITDGDSAGENSKGNNSVCMDGAVSFLSAGENHIHSGLGSSVDQTGLQSIVDGQSANVPSFLDCCSGFPPSVKRQFSSTSDGSAEAVVNNSQEDVGDAVGTVVTGDGPFMKSRIRIKNETVLITRLDGINLSTDKETSMYKCYICGTMLSSLSNVQVHLSMHFDLEITTYQCRHCDATFESKHQMLQHVLSHKINSKLEGREKTDVEINGTEDRLLMEDEELSESFVSGKKQKPDINENTDLAADLCLEKSGAKLVGSWECKYCRKSFSRLYLLQRHERIHNGQRMFYCKECRKGFSESVNLHQHMLRFHDIPQTLYNQMESGLPRKMDKVDLQSLMRIAYWDKLSENTAQEGSGTNSEEIHSPEGEQHLKDLERAKEFLEKEGLQENITVVMPSEPPTEQELTNSDTQHSASNHASDSDPEDPEIKAAPKRSLMSFRKEGPPSKSRRKAALPVKLDSVKTSMESTATTSSALSSHPEADSDAAAHAKDIIPTDDIKKEVGEEALGGDPGDQDISSTLPISNSVLKTVLPSSAVLASLNPLILASTVAAAAAAAAAAASQSDSQLLSGSSLASGLPGYTTVSMPMPISVLVSESQPGGKAVSPSRSSSSPSQPSPADPDSLVGFPRVQWNPSPSDSSSGPSPPDGRKLHHSWHHVSSDGISSDGRKVTSLSRTHSRLHVVNQPIDRDLVCKPVVLPDGRAVFRCVFCSKDFLSFSDINRHMDFHEDIRPYKCKYCDYYARTNSQLKVHMMRHQGIRDFCCKLCNYKGVTQSDLNRHMKSQIHLLKSQNECQHCREGFVTARNLEKHLDGNCIVKMHDLDTTD